MSKKSKKTYAQKLIPIIVIAILLYTIVAIVLQFIKGIEISSTLTSCYFLFWGSEIVSLALIKTGKVKNLKEYKDAKKEILNAKDVYAEDTNNDEYFEGEKMEDK